MFILRPLWLGILPFKMIGIIDWRIKLISRASDDLQLFLLAHLEWCNCALDLFLLIHYSVDYQFVLLIQCWLDGLCTIFEHLKPLRNTNFSINTGVVARSVLNRFAEQNSNLIDFVLHDMPDITPRSTYNIVLRDVVVGFVHKLQDRDKVRIRWVPKNRCDVQRLNVRSVR